jgi:hypothetical protein
MKTKATPLSWALQYADLDWRAVPIYEVTNGKCACSLGIMQTPAPDDFSATG